MIQSLLFMGLGELIMYLAQIKDTAANHYTVRKWRRYVRSILKEYLYPNLQEYKDFCDSWIIKEATA